MSKYAVLGLGLACVWQLHAAGPLHKNLPPCEPGFQWVEETVIKEVPRFCCKTVPNTKIKWCYKCVEDPFCIPHTQKHGCCKPGCGGACGTPNCGTACNGPYGRVQLVKWQVDVPCPGTKCVVEKTMEKVPCIELRKVPCVPTSRTTFGYPVSFSRPEKN